MSKAVQELVNIIKEKDLSKNENNLLLESLLEKDPDFKDILYSLINGVSNNVPGLSNLRPQAKIMRVLKIFALMQYGFIDKGIEELKKQMIIQTAEDEWLDLHAKDHGVVRKSRTKATGKVWIGSKTKPKDKHILPDLFMVGTKSSTDQESLRFKILDRLTIDSATPQNKYGYVIEVNIEAENGGSEYNLQEGSITEIFTKVKGFDIVIQEKDTSGGVSVEKDDDFRKRIINKTSGSLEWTPGWFKLKAESFKNIREAKTIPGINGAGTVGVILRGTGNSLPGKDIKAVQDYFDSEEVKPIANWQTFVKDVVRHIIALTVVIHHNIDESISESKVRLVIQEYFNNLNIGDDFRASELTAFIIREISKVAGVEVNSIKRNKVVLEKVDTVGISDKEVFIYDSKDTVITFEENL